MTLRHGARQQLDYLEADLNEILDEIQEMAWNPAAIEALVEKCKRRLRDEIEPRLQRAEPTLAQKIAELEIRLERVEQQKVIFVKAE
jgi:flagellar biosynthesis component FlhA